MKVASSALLQRRDPYNEERGCLLKSWAKKIMVAQEKRDAERLDAAVRKEYANNTR